MDNATVTKEHAEDDIWHSIRASDLAEIVFPLSDKVQELLGNSYVGEVRPAGHAQRLVDIIHSSEVMWKAHYFPSENCFVLRSEYHLEGCAKLVPYMGIYDPKLPLPTQTEHTRCKATWVCSNE